MTVESRLRAAYDLALRDVARRLKAEKESEERDTQRNRDANGGDDVSGDIPPVAGTELAHRVVDGAPGPEPEKVIVVAHGGNDVAI